LILDSRFDSAQRPVAERSRSLSCQSFNPENPDSDIWAIKKADLNPQSWSSHYQSNKIKPAFPRAFSYSCWI